MNFLPLLGVRLTRAITSIQFDPERPGAGLQLWHPTRELSDIDAEWLPSLEHRVVPPTSSHRGTA
jgi:hypothetical protein